MSGSMQNNHYNDLTRAVYKGNFERARELIAAYGLHHLSERNSDYHMLCNALLKRRKKIVKLLLQSGCTVNHKKKRKIDTPLHLAASYHDAKIVAMLLDRDAEVNAQNATGQTALHCAVRRNKAEIIELLLKKNGNVRICDNTNKTPIHISIIYRHVEIMKMLLKYNPCMDVKYWEGMNLLHFAVEYGNAEIVEYLLNHGAFIQIASTSIKNGFTPLHRAVTRGNEDIVRVLLNKGADVNARTKDHSRPVHIATELLYTEIVKVLLKHDGVDIDARNKSGQTILDIAMSKAHLPILDAIFEIHPDVKNSNIRYSLRDLVHHPGSYSKITELFFDNGSIVNPEDASDRQFVHVLVGQGCANVLKFILHCGVNLNSWIMQGATLLHTAAFYRQLDVAKMLIKYGAEVNVVDMFGKFPISYAIQNLDAEMTILLMSSGAELGFDINYRDKMEKTVLQDFISVYRDNGKVIRDLTELFLSRGADTHGDRVDNWSLLHSAVLEDYDGIVEILLNHKANVNLVSRESMETPLHISVYRENVTITRMLLNAGARFDIKNSYGETAFHIACQGMSGAIVDMLLELGPPIDEKKNDEFTPLYLSAIRGFPNIVESLLRASADTEITDKNGRTALHVAANYEHYDIVSELLDYGADINVTCKMGHSPLDYTNPALRFGDFIDDYLLRKHDGTETTIKQHIIKMRALNLYVSRRNLETIDFKNSYEFLQIICEREIASMKSEKIGQTDISYCDLLLKDVNQLAALTRNESVTQVLESCCSDERFPTYRKMLYYKFKKAQKRENLLNSSLQSLNSLLGFALPELVAREIFSHLSFRDLENLIKADSVQ